MLHRIAPILLSIAVAILAMTLCCDLLGAHPREVRRAPQVAPMTAPSADGLPSCFERDCIA
jgi:hypothetical protein